MRRAAVKMAGRRWDAVGGGCFALASHKSSLLGKRFGFLFFFSGGSIESCVSSHERLTHSLTHHHHHHHHGATDTTTTTSHESRLTTHDSRERENRDRHQEKKWEEGRCCMSRVEAAIHVDSRRVHARGNGARKHHIGIANTSRCVFDERAI